MASSTRKQQIAALVRAGREHKGWTQTELAERVGVNMQSISHIERAMHKPREALMDKLEAVLNIDLSAEARAIHAKLDEIVAKLSERVRDLDPVQGIQMASDILEKVETWRPKAPKT